ncbi:hypothetical protein [Nostoc sp.]|uniref:hypothetical protein n=1 Tax=Nostoc sp. TaxID=1180 RepID=UPI002FFB5242
MTIGGTLVAIAIIGCNASAKSQPPAVNTSSVANLIASSPTPAPVSPTQSPTNTKLPGQDAVQVIRDYYSAITRQDYKQAYSAWEGNGAASKQSFEQFKQGFANTTSVAVEVGKPGTPDPGAGSIYIEIPVTVTAIGTNGTPQRFRGSYVLRRVNDVPGSTPEQRRWHLHSANITQVK